MIFFITGAVVQILHCTLTFESTEIIGFDSRVIINLSACCTGEGEPFSLPAKTVDVVNKHGNAAMKIIFFNVFSIMLLPDSDYYAFLVGSKNSITER